jgi:hypothetical protein
VPHVSVQRIYQLDWAALAALGFKGCVLDKDNTLTRPYSMELESGVKASLEKSQAIFNGNVVVFSNSAGAFAPEQHKLHCEIRAQAVIRNDVSAYCRPCQHWGMHITGMLKSPTNAPLNNMPRQQLE